MLPDVRSELDRLREGPVARAIAHEKRKPVHVAPILLKEEPLAVIGVIPKNIRVHRLHGLRLNPGLDREFFFQLREIRAGVDPVPCPAEPRRRAVGILHRLRASMHGGGQPASGQILRIHRKRIVQKFCGSPCDAGLSGDRDRESDHVVLCSLMPGPHRKIERLPGLERKRGDGIHEPAAWRNRLSRENDLLLRQTLLTNHKGKCGRLGMQAPPLRRDLVVACLRRRPAHVCHIRCRRLVAPRSNRNLVGLHREAAALQFVSGGVFCNKWRLPTGRCPAVQAIDPGDRFRGRKRRDRRASVARKPVGPWTIGIFFRAEVRRKFPRPGRVCRMGIGHDEQTKQLEQEKWEEADHGRPIMDLPCRHHQLFQAKKPLELPRARNDIEEKHIDDLSISRGRVRLRPNPNITVRTEPTLPSVA